MSFDASCGTPIWEFNQFRIYVLSGLLDDLSDREKEGLREEQCRQVRTALSRVNDIADRADDRSFWKRNIKKHVKKLLDIYLEWNDHEGTTPEIVARRRKDFSKLRRCREMASNKWGQKQQVFANELDARMVEALYEAFNGFCNAYPQIFRHTRRAIYQVSQKKSHN